MRYLNRIGYGLLRRFRADQRGNFATMFAVIATVLLLAASLALDTARMYSTHTKMTQAIDAAVLATTQGLTQGDIPIEDAESAVLAYINANLDGRSLEGGDIVIDDIIVNTSDKSLEVKAHTMMPMTMGGLVGYNEQLVATTSKAQFANTNVEVVMALDITGSMDWTIGNGDNTKKIAALKTAATLGIQTLLSPGASGGDRIRIGLVPYSETVNIGNYINDIETSDTQEYVCTQTFWGFCLGREWRNKNTTCVYERSGANKYTDAFAGTNAKIPMSDSDYACPNARITTLTNNSGLLNGKIESYSAAGGTAGHIAIAWAYYMLSPKWNSIWPSDAQVEDFGAAGSSKYAIIMTDGEFNTFQTDNIDDPYYSSLYATNLCASMKNDGIKIYSIAFAVKEATAATLMNDCASTNADGNKQYYPATDQQSLEAAFVAIAQDIQGLRLVN